MTDPVPETLTFPEVIDSSGYTLLDTDFSFLGIDPTAAWACVFRDSPLGVPQNKFEFFVSTLFEALSRESLHDADVRIQGSSATFFSSTAKKFPQTRAERARLFTNEHGRLSQLQETREIEARVTEQWPGGFPGQRPFDSMHRLGLSPDPSDIDVQISSDLAFDIAREVARSREIDPENIRFKNASYDFLIKEISDTEFLYLQRWANTWQESLSRGVSIAIFDRSGPPTRVEGLSSHFKFSDWVVPHRESNTDD